MNALRSLATTPLYTEQKVHIVENWKTITETRQQQSSMNICFQPKIDDDNYELDDDPTAKSLIHWFNDTQSIKDLDTTIIQIAPLEGIKPLGIF